MKTSRFKRSGLHFGLVTVFATLLAAPAAWAATGDQIGAEFQVHIGTEPLRPAVASDGAGNFVVVWATHDAIYARFYGSDGLPKGDEFPLAQISVPPPIFDGKLSVAMNSSGKFVVVWATSSDMTHEVINAQRYLADGTADGAVIQVAAPQQAYYGAAPSVAMDAAGDFVVAWRQISELDVPVGAVFFQLLRTSSVYARLYNAEGRAKGSAFLVDVPFVQVLEAVSGQPTVAAPGIAMDSRGRFVIAWQDVISDSGLISGSGLIDGAVNVMRFSAVGLPLGVKQRVAATWPGWITQPVVALGADDSFAVGWMDIVADPLTLNRTAVRMRRYNNIGIAQGPASDVSARTARPYSAVCAVVRPDGGLLFAWDGNDPTPPYSRNIYSQNYAADGTPQGGNALVNTTTTGIQSLPSLAVTDADGDYVIVWASTPDNTGSQYSIYGQRFSGR